MYAGKLKGGGGYYRKVKERGRLIAEKLVKTF
jgi:hypothetical protein